MRNLLRISIAAALLAVPSISLAAGAAAASRSTYAINCDREQYRPGRITLSCADAGIWLAKLTWSSWGRDRAVGAGTYDENTCTPNCATGHVVGKPVRVILSKPKTCPGESRRGFTRATFSFPSGAPPSAYDRFTFVCPVLPGQY